MIQTQIALLRREIWEHRAVFIVPLVVALLMALVSLTGQVTINEVRHIDLGIIGASNMPENARASALAIVMFGLTTPFIFAMWILIIFYSLDALYAERKDRSILFWRSIPVTDAETVLSKLFTAILAIPLVTFAVSVVTHLVVLLNVSIWVDIRGGSPWELIWTAAPFADTWAAALILLVALPLWLSPFIGWFLFVSAFAKRSPLLVAALPIALLPLLEKLFLGSSLMAQAFFVRSVKMPLFSGLDNLDLLMSDTGRLEAAADAKISLLKLLDLGAFVTDIQLWLGLAVCGLFVAAAIYVRRYRDDS